MGDEQHRSDDGPSVEVAQLSNPYQHKPWRPGMSRRFTHRWQATQLPGDAKEVRIVPTYQAADQTCSNCGLRRLREDDRDGFLGAWAYKRPTWEKWRKAADFCALRPDAPATKLKYERKMPRGYRPR